MAEEPAAAGGPDIDPAASKITAEWKYEPSPLIGCRFDPRGKYLVTGTQDNRALRWDLPNGKPTPLVGHQSWVRACGFSDGGQTIWTGGYDGRLIAWPADDEQPEPRRTIDAHQGWIRAVSVSPDQSLIATGGNDLAVRIWHTQTGAKMAELTGHERHVYSLAFDSTGELLYSGDLFGVVKVWNAASGELKQTFDAKKLYTPNPGQGAEYGGVRSLALSTERDELICGGLYNASNPFGAEQEPLVVVLAASDGSAKRTHIAQGNAKAICWRALPHPQGFLIGGCGGKAGGFLCFWKPDQETEFHRHGLPNTVFDMDLHPDGRQVATVHYDRHVRITQLG